METNAFAQFSQEPLPYAFDALEPAIDKMTMEIHYGRHHKAYVDNLNKAVAGLPQEKLSLLDLQKSITPETPAAIRNNGGGVWNHTFFFNGMAPNAGGEPKGELGTAIVATWGSFDKFKEEFKKAALGRFGSGWVWLTVANGKLVIQSTPNQDNPLMSVSDVKGTPVLSLDVWEHAYYLKYQNKRADYTDAYWNVVNWDRANQLYKAAK
ncbi:MAG: superoxide dismutase [Marinilabiliales bacterium]|nr:superoxide dismutase [Marinilabiliales bacterium]